VSSTHPRQTSLPWRPRKGDSHLSLPADRQRFEVSADRIRHRDHLGRIGFKNRKVNLSTVFAGQLVGVRQVDEHAWPVTFKHYDLG
jgi:hypothetical protein